MARVLNRYVFVECMPPLGISAAVFSFVLLMHRLLLLSDLVLTKGVAVTEVLQLLALALPGVLSLLFPASLLLAVLFAVGRLSADSEIVAMRACGVGLAENLRPVMLLAAGACALTAAASLWAQPFALRSFREFLYHSVRSRISLTTQTGTFTEITKGITVYAEKVDEESGIMENLFLYLDRGTTRGVWILARSGSLKGVSGVLTLDLRRGEMHQRESEDKPYRLLRFAEYELRIPLPAAVWDLGIEEQPTGVLLSRLFSGEAAPDLRVELHQRFALPASCLVFGVLGASHGLHHFRGGRSRGVSLGFGVLLLFYALFAAGRALGGRGVILPELAIWAPDLALGTLAAYAFGRKNREAPLPLEEAFFGWLSRAWRRLRPRRLAR